MEKIILASSSPRRKELLEQVGINFDILPSNEEEIITKINPSEIVEELSLQKANSVLKMVTNDSIIIGADTIVSLNNNIMGKPHDKNDAYNMLKQLQNNTHTVYTGVCVIIKKGIDCKVIVFHDSTDVTMYPMTNKQIYDYIDTNEPFDKAGSYGIQGQSAIYIKKICGDYNNVVGLPIAKLYNTLLDIGIDLKNY
ncbi:septum formation inhibitor Maf [Sedimentibacter sp. zth1]|uniref:Maf family protein n=1 Tax=Sedimentibacter sp. zth1 TaxID=2816908 RepID=UPI001A9204BD|nr:Maf family protein [Sedimentibacter sp. zth1]QSX05032.1 septum formation inhibitor Maf [Sedimentibacter sp. zth1]